MADGVLGEVEDVGADERLAAGDEERGAADRGEIVDEGDRFIRGELADELRFLGVGVAVDALEVAGLGRVPDDDRAGANIRSAAGLAGRFGVTEAVAVKGRSAEKFGHAKH